MKNLQAKKIISDWAPVLVSVLLVIILFFLPTGFEGAEQFKDAEKCRVKVTAVDNSRFIDTGLIRSGQQICKVTILSGKFKGMQTEGWNMLTGSLAQDKIFKAGDVAQAIIHYDLTNPDDAASANFFSVNLIDYYRLHGELILALLFAAFLIIFAGKTGVRSVLSFILTVLVLWKVLVPLNLRGVDPMLSALFITLVLTVAIISLVYGFDKRLLAAGGGAMLGILFSAVLSIICTSSFKIHGAVMPDSESVLYSGYEFLNLTRIFMASVCVGASGSVMDLAVDITSAVSEVVRNCPTISKKEAIKSGLTVARNAMGTMTTTLLLAYSSSSIALLMAFMAQGTPIYNILNNNQVAAEIINTIAGSFGLAATAPFTAVLSGIILTKKKSPTSKEVQ